MVGSGNRKDESLVINSNNVFAALGNLKKKKKSSKEQGSSKSKAKPAEKEKEKEVFWAPTRLTAKSWADVDDEDDDDYYATTALPQSVWGTVDSNPQKELQEPPVEESESEEEGLDEVDDDVEEEHEHETETAVEVEPIVMKPPEIPLAPKDPERQLSKKELKKKDLEELDALLAEMGLKKETSGQDGSHGVAQEKKGEDNEDFEKKDDGPAESKTAKKKKKKDKSVKEAKDLSENQPDGANAGGGTDETAGTKKAEDTSIDVKERLKKVASMKKKKSSKEMDAAARAAAGEAAARSAKLAAAKKKEKNHYNQQPVR
ncbi:ABC transporter F family member 4-like isoform X2 [Mangifera indica]|uniref:ABC transporter F family member 4-like isoform X2 n=1 Tax=Mangifera indica TaxID=29780 RepID=UPI001CF9FF5E|nr:ABC transporter F family member 4-like isoform X2 [Mangifera indica]